MLTKYFSRITLFTVLACLSLVALIITAISHQPEEIKAPVAYRLIMATLLFISIDILLKQVLKLKIGWLWFIQICLVLVAVYIWIVSE